MQVPVRPKDFAQQLDIVVEPFCPPQIDISGYLMRYGNSFGIGYSTAIQSAGFQNFTVAHELGHYFIDDHPAAILANGQHLSRSGYISKDRFEREADTFATELLMPWRLIEPIIGANAGGFATIKSIAESCESSLLASAIRYTQVTGECVAVIVSRLGVVEFMTASTSFKQIPGIDWLHKQDSLPTDVPSSESATDLDWIRRCEVTRERARLCAWFSGADGREVEEDIVGLGSYERLLTVLLTEETELDEAGGEEPEDDYIERWKRGVFRGKR
jgi:hypothetical protein